MNKKRVCQQCGKEIITQGSKYCSAKCRNAFARAKYKKARLSMPERICIQCGKILPSRRWRYCSEDCYRKFQHAIYITHNPFRGTCAATTGAISELRVAIDLLAKGYDVFRALSPACPCDLAILKDSQLLRVEVRTGYTSISGNIYRSSITGKDATKIDLYAWVLPDKIVYEPELE